MNDLLKCELAAVAKALGAGVGGGAGALFAFLLNRYVAHLPITLEGAIAIATSMAGAAALAYFAPENERCLHPESPSE